MSIPSIEQLRERARTDFANGRRGSTLIEWAFILAAAKGRLALAERELRAIEDWERDVRYRAAVMTNDQAAEMVLSNGPGDLELGRKKGDHALAVEYVAAAEEVLALLAKAPKPVVSGHVSRNPVAQNGARR